MALGTGEDFEGAIKPSSVEKAVYESDLFAQRITEIPSNMQMRAAYSSNDGMPDYVGFAPKGLTTFSDGWLLQEFTYDGNRQCTLRQIGYGSWDGRATVSYS
jgi:hypothetical protein